MISVLPSLSLWAPLMCPAPRKLLSKHALTLYHLAGRCLYLHFSDEGTEARDQLFWSVWKQGCELRSVSVAYNRSRIPQIKIKLKILNFTEIPHRSPILMILSLLLSIRYVKNTDVQRDKVCQENVLNLINWFM